MGKMYDWLSKGRKESIEAYENRINACQPLHAGYVFFDRINYDAVHHVFSTFAVWNGELNSKLQDELPGGGFEVHCSRHEAELFCNETMGVPVFIKLFIKTGRLYAKELFIQYSDKKFLVTFTGCEVVPLQLVCFRGFGEVPQISKPQDNINIYHGSGFPLRISYETSSLEKNIPITSSNYIGSRKMLYHAGSGNLQMGSGYRLRTSSYLLSGTGYRLERYSLTGSYQKNSSYRLVTSNNFQFNWNYNYGGSYSRTSAFMGIHGSSHNNMLGSMRTSYRKQLFNSSLCYELGEDLDDGIWGPEYWKEIFGIGSLGYGLNII